MMETYKVAIIDALGSENGVRHSTRDAVGCGPRRIAGILEAKGLVVRILLAEEAINRPNLMSAFDILMVSAMSIDKKAVRKIIDLWRQKKGNKPAVIGGPVTSEPEILLRFGYDAVVTGEGESSVLRILKDELKNGELSAELRQTIIADGKALKGWTGSYESSHKECSGYDYNHDHEVLNSYDPSITCVKDYPSYRALRFYVETVRGCSNFIRTSIPLPEGAKCIECHKCRDGKLEERIQCPVGIPPGCGFCSVPSRFGCSRSRDEAKIVNEARELIRAGVRRIVLSASDFLDYQRDKLVATSPLTDPHYPPPNTAGIESLLSKLTAMERKSNTAEKDHAYFSVENVKPCLFTDEVASIIAEYLPLSTIHLGCETGSEEHSSKLGRPSTPAQTLEAVRVAVKHGLRPYVYFIHGLPGQTSQTARETVEIMKKMIESSAEKITIYKFKPLPLSAFEKFPPALPAREDKNSKKIERIARRLNMQSKLKMLGETLDVIVFGLASEGIKSGMIAYPVSEGPVVIIPRKAAREGDRLKVKITEVLSDRLVRGEIY